MPVPFVQRPGYAAVQLLQQHSTRGGGSGGGDQDGPNVWCNACWHGTWRVCDVVQQLQWRDAAALLPACHQLRRWPWPSACRQHCWAHCSGKQHDAHVLKPCIATVKMLALPIASRSAAARALFSAPTLVPADHLQVCPGGLCHVPHDGVHHLRLVELVFAC